MLSTDARDDAIRQTYAQVPDTADEIVSDPVLAVQFCESVNQALPDGQRFEVAELNHRLLNLRRRGEENGGLIRKQRNYRGRGSKPR